MKKFSYFWHCRGVFSGVSAVGLRRMRRSWQGMAIALSLLLGLLLYPVSAQINSQPPPKVPIILDGDRLFSVGDSEQFPARERADWIESELVRFAESPSEIDVRIEERNGLPTIVVNGRYLLTVTEQDVLPEKYPLETQASAWAETLEKALEQAHRERSGKFLQVTLLKAILALAGALVLYWGLGRLWRRGFQWGAAPDPSRSLTKMLQLTLVMARLVVLVATVLYITNLFPWTRQWSYQFLDILVQSLTAPLLTTDQRSYSITNLLILIGLLVGLVSLANTLSNQLRSRILPIAGLNRNTREVVTAIVKYTTIVIGTVILLQLWGIELSSLTILASALSVGIGFGFQDIAKNLGSGIVLMFERPIQVGDFVQVGTYVGTVERIGSRSTLIRTLDQVSIIVPNSRFLESEVINWTHDNPVSRLRLEIGVAYGSDLQVVQSLLLKAAQNHTDVLKLPPPRVVFSRFGDHSLDFELWVWFRDPSRQYILKSDLYFAIEELFRKSEIEIPFCQNDVHLRSGSLPLELSPNLEKMILTLLQQMGKIS